MSELEIDRRDLVLLGILSILWGGSFFFVGVAVNELPACTIVFGRVAIAAPLILSVLAFLRMRLPADARLWFSFFVMSLLNNVAPFLLITLGQKQMPSGLASIINATTPLFTVLIMAAFGEERLIVSKVLGVLVGLIGVAILYGAGKFLTGHSSGIVLCLGAALSYGFAGFWGRRTLSGIPPITSTAGQLMCSSVIMAFVASFVDHPWQLPMPSESTWLALIGLAAFSTALAYVIFFQILLRSGGTTVMLVTLLIPVTAIYLGHVFLGEPVNAREIIGAITIGSALIIVDGRALRWIQAQADIGRSR